MPEAPQESLLSYIQNVAIKSALEAYQSLSSSQPTTLIITESLLQQQWDHMNASEAISLMTQSHQHKALFLRLTWTEESVEWTCLGYTPPRRPDSVLQDAIRGCIIVYVLRSFACVEMNAELSLDLQCTSHIWYAACSGDTGVFVLHHQGDTHTMRPGHSVLIKMPSENTKCITLPTSSMLNMGKFGSFHSALLHHQPYSCYYHIVSSTELVPADNMDSQQVLDAFQFQPSIETQANNQHIVDDQSSQKLTIQEIQDMRDKNIKGEMDAGDVIKKIVENSVTFEKKTEFAKAKYIKRKVKKFTRVIQPLYPTALNLCEYYQGKCAQKIRELRIDTLTQMMSLANVRAGGKYLVVDDISGLLIGAVMERMGGEGCIIGVHHDVQAAYDILKYMNLSAWQSSVLVTCSYNKIGAPIQHDESSLNQIEASSMETAEVRRVRLHHRLYKLRNTLELMEKRDFDGLLIASEFNVTPIIERLQPYLKGSAPLVVFHPFKEALLQPFLSLRESPHFTFAQLSESWLREYQVPIKSLSGTHPHMTTSSGGGFILSAVAVKYDPNVVLDLRHKKGKKPRK